MPRRPHIIDDPERSAYFAEHPQLAARRQKLLERRLADAEEYARVKEEGRLRGKCLKEIECECADKTYGPQRGQAGT